MIRITSSMWSMAVRNPSRRWRRSSAFLRSVLGPPSEGLPPMGDVQPQEVSQREDPGALVDETQVDHAEAGLERGMLVDPVEDDLGGGVPPQLEDDAGAVPVRLVPQVRDAVDPFRLDEVGDQLQERGLVDLVRDLGDDDLRPPVALPDLGRPPEPQGPPAGLVRLPDPLRGVQHPARREVGGRKDGHDLVEGRRRVLQEQQQGVDELPQVVGRHVRRHADGDPGRAVQQEIRDLPGKYERLLQGPVKVVPPLDGLLLDVLEHLLGKGREPGLGVPHRRGRIAIDGAEVPLAVDEEVAERERLGHPDQRIVDGELAVGVVLAEDVPDRARGLAVRLVVGRPRLPHRPEDTAVDRLQAVPSVGEGPPDDDAHGVVEVGFVHLPLERLVLRAAEVQRVVRVRALRGRGAHAVASGGSWAATSRFASARNASR